jgi:hypothetical protein
MAALASFEFNEPFDFRCTFPLERSMEEISERTILFEQNFGRIRVVKLHRKGIAAG